MKTIFPALVVTALLACFAPSLRAEGVHFDVLVTSSTNSGSKLIIGGFNDVAGTGTVPAEQMRVFKGEVTGSTAAPYSTGGAGEPGFRAPIQSVLNNPALTSPAGVYTALAPSTPLSFSFMPITIDSNTRNLFFWDGSGTVAFAPVASNVALNLINNDPTWNLGITGTSAGVIPGNVISTSGSGGAAGFVHHHLNTAISEAGGAPDPGFYLYSLRLEMAGYTSSEQLYFVYGADNLSAPMANFELKHEMAEDWVKGNVAVLPEPSSLALAGLGAAGAGLAALRSRRRRAGRKAARVAI